MTTNVDYKRIGRFAIFGAAGFGIGGLILAIASEAAAGVNWKTADMGEVMPLLLFPLFVVIAGAIGGIALGLALWRRISLRLAFLMAIGFFLGIPAIWVSGIRPSGINDIPFTTLFGLVLGILLGLTLGSWRKFLLLSIAGALGGAVAGVITYPVHSYVWYIIPFQGVIGGAFLGGALGFLISAEDEQKVALEMDKKVQKTKVGIGETFYSSTNMCPYCNSQAIEGGVIYLTKTDKERKTLGYGTKRQLVCLKCKSKWISVEK